MPRVFRSIAPLRLGLAGGGTDVSPYCDTFGGMVLNATVNHYAHCSIVPRDDGKLVFEAQDLQISESHAIGRIPDEQSGLSLHRAVYNFIIESFPECSAQGATISTYCDAPPGSGLGSSSTVVVALVQAFSEWLSLPFGEYDVAKFAYEVERVRLGYRGGRQDQYAAAFGGFNFIEFLRDGAVIVNPLRIKRSVVTELEESIVLFNSSVSRESKHIIEQQARNVEQNHSDSLEATHQLREGAASMKRVLLKGDLDGMAKIFVESWNAKRNLASGISTPTVEKILDTAMHAGATAGKVSGAGGGGFVMLMVRPEQRLRVEHALSKCEGQCLPFRFSAEGVKSWSVVRE